MSEVTCSTLIEQNNAFLLVQEGCDPQQRFNLPGGAPKAREDVLSCAVRETAEETGLTVRLNHLVGIYQCTRTEACNNLTRLVFAGTTMAGTLVSTEKHPAVDYFSFEDVLRMEDEGALSNNGIVRAIKDYRKQRGTGLAIVTILPKVKSDRNQPFVG